MKAIIVGFSDNIHRNNFREKPDEARGNLNTKSLEIIEAETFDDDTSKCTENTIWSDGTENHCYIEPRHWIYESFNNVRPFDMMIGNSLIILSNSFKGHITLSVVEHSGAGRIVGKYEENENTPNDGASASE